MNCLRPALLPDVNLRVLRAALKNPATGLTYEALSGKNEQSVPDCERLVSEGVISFLERAGHDDCAKVIRIIHNWHKAVDGRGICENERSQYIEAMKDWLMDDWMPWHSENPDLSRIDVNR